MRAHPFAGLPAFVILALVLALAAPARAKTPAPAAFSDLMAAVRQSAALREDLHAAVEAEKNAMLAGTSEAARPFLEEARQAAGRVEDGRLVLALALERLGRGPETEMFADFSRAWTELLAVHREIMALAPENTNKLATELSRGSASQAATRLETALEALLDVSADSPQASALARRSQELTAACLKILSLQAPHIAEAEDGRMDTMEAEMRARLDKGDRALEFLARSVPPTAQASLALAGAAWKDFQRINTEILALSRRNSDVRSLALVLGRGRTLAAQCSASLKALSDKLLERHGKATR